MHLALDQERVSPSGNLMSNGVLNQLGRPNLEILSVLVREAVQNSWDARASDDKSVLFGISGWASSETQRQCFAQNVFSNSPSDSVLPLASLIKDAQALNVLVLYDRGTLGLGGPTHADEIAQDGEPSHFVNFLRNVGQATNRAFTGGTYGYGKAAFYRASQARTICVYTRTWFRGRLESRFIAAALGQPHVDVSSRYTGRSWWGIPSNENSLMVDPLLNNVADEIAAAIGMPMFEADACGTNIMVIEPHFGERTPLQAVNWMAENILWYFWPKLMTMDTGYTAMNVEVSWEGHRIEIPKPETYPPLKGFVEAMYLVQDSEYAKFSHLRRSVQSLNTVRPKQILGKLALHEFQPSNKPSFDTGSESNTSPFAHLTHHTALMRQPKLVVKYLQGPSLIDNSKGYAGVFVSNQDVDSIFASAEPPTHDDWVSNSLEERNHRVFINQALKQIQRGMDDFAAQDSETGKSPSELHPLGSISRRLGSLLLKDREQAQQLINGSIPSRVNFPTKSQALDGSANLSGTVLFSPFATANQNSDSLLTEPQRNNSEINLQQVRDSLGMYHPANGSSEPNQKPAGRAQVNYSAQRLLITENNIPAVKVDFSVDHAPNSVGSIIQVSASVLLDGNTREAQPPVGQVQPQIIYWSDSCNNRYADSETLFIPVQMRETYSVVVSVPGNVMLRIELNATAQGF